MATAVERSRSLSKEGASAASGSSRRRLLARTIRFCTFASVVSKARAISGVLKPLTVRKAKASRDSIGTAS